MATQKAMAASRDPDALFRGLLESGEVSLDDVSKYEALFGYFPYAAWVARVTHIFFLGETPKVVTELMACLRGLQFVSPAGDLNMHAPYLELSTLLNKCAAKYQSLGLDSLRTGITERAAAFYKALESTNAKPMVTSDRYKSPTLFAVNVEEDANELRAKLEKEHGIYTGACYGDLKAHNFRVANFPMHTSEEHQKLLALL
jgi:hypothetical protein